MNRRGLVLALAVVLALAAPSCGADSRSLPAPALVRNNVTVTVVPALDPLPFDPQAARIVQATDTLFRVVGHPVELRFDQALVPQFSSGFADALASGLESVARSLDSLRATDPRLFAREVPALHRIDCHYSATASRGEEETSPANEPRFDGGVVTLAEAATGRLLDGGAVAEALEERFDEDTEARFDGREPEAIAPADRADYLAFVSSSHRSLAARRRHPFASSSEQTDTLALSALRTVKLAQLVGSSDAKLAQAIRTKLLELGTFLTEERNGNSPVEKAAPGSILRRALEAWVAWIDAALPSFDARERLALATLVFERPHSLPGFDDFGFGLQVVDAWEKAGRPLEGAEDDASFRLMDMVVCPATYDSRGIVERNRGCHSGWLDHALVVDGDTPASQALGKALAARNDVRLVESLACEAQYREGVVLRRLWHAVEPYPAVFHVVTRAILERLPGHSLLGNDDANQIWRDRPGYRGSALYILGVVSKQWGGGYSDESFASFAQRYGKAVDADTFGAFLDEGPGAFAITPYVWRALGEGWSRGAVLAAHLDRLLDAAPPPAPIYGAPDVALERIAQRLCDDGLAGDIAQLHAALVARVKAHPDSARTLDNVVRDTGARCVPGKKAEHASEF